MQGAVAAAPLQQTEQGAARRYDWFEHGKTPHIKLSTRPGDTGGSPVGRYIARTPRPRGNIRGRPSSFACL
ncbi:hypothetical protein GCM10010275_59950 [Streptomyces litmocidini]|nr:hypothetical protein GCM10010275_59950 [Streptomyces litmocidini]